MSKSVEDAITIIERMTLSGNQGHYNRSPTKSKNGIIVLNTNTAILSQNKLLVQISNALTKQLSKLPK